MPCALRACHSVSYWRLPSWLGVLASTRSPVSSSADGRTPARTLRAQAAGAGGRGAPVGGWVGGGEAALRVPARRAQPLGDSSRCSHARTQVGLRRHTRAAPRCRAPRGKHLQVGRDVRVDVRADVQVGHLHRPRDAPAAAGRAERRRGPTRGRGHGRGQPRCSWVGRSRRARRVHRSSARQEKHRTSPGRRRRPTTPRRVGGAQHLFRGRPRGDYVSRAASAQIGAIRPCCTAAAQLGYDRAADGVDGAITGTSQRDAEIETALRVEGLAVDPWACVSRGRLGARRAASTSVGRRRDHVPPPSVLARPGCGRRAPDPAALAAGLLRATPVTIGAAPATLLIPQAQQSCAGREGGHTLECGCKTAVRGAPVTVGVCKWLDAAPIAQLDCVFWAHMKTCSGTARLLRWRPRLTDTCMGPGTRLIVQSGCTPMLRWWSEP